MKITNIFAKANPPSAKTRGYGSVEFDGQVSINFSIFSGPNGDFVSWPKYKKQDGNWQSHVYFKDETFRDEVSKQVLEKLRTGGSSTPSGPTPQDAPGFNANDEIPF